MPAALPRIRVGDNRRFLATESGEPFFWLGDTAWELFHRTTIEEAETYLENRRRKGFNVIQAVALAELDGLRVPNAYGHTPLIDLDPNQPNEAYFHYVDAVIDLAAEKGLYIGLLPTWGDKVVALWGVGPVVFDQSNAYRYGQWLGARYRERSNVLWILGGDRPAITLERDYRPLWRALAAGIDAATGGQAFMTYHPNGGHSTAEWLHDESWLDVNMLQSGHGSGHDTPVWEMIAAAYTPIPTRPVLDGEPNYEDHPVNPWPQWDPARGYYRDHDVRKQCYRSVFAGGCGVTYGHHSIWQFSSPERPPVNHPDRSWREALDRPGAAHLIHLRCLMESRPYFTRVPDQGLLLSEEGERGRHLRATRDGEGRYAFVYIPNPGQSVRLDLSAIAGETARASWYDPCSGQSTALGHFPTSVPQTFTSPGEGLDWVLVLDSAAEA